jgi:hypothetical protein
MAGGKGFLSFSLVISNNGSLFSEPGVLITTVYYFKSGFVE